MVNSDSRETAVPEKREPVVERRRSSLPQPDFTPYQRAKVYPGSEYFFVGHSYNVEGCADDTSIHQAKRADAIGSLFSESTPWVLVGQALQSEKLVSVLSRCERDLLHRLPESALLGPALDWRGNIISESFTVWRREMRRQYQPNN